MTDGHGARWGRHLIPLLSVLLFGVALFALREELLRYRWHDVVSRMRELPREKLTWALGLTALSYTALTGYDRLAFRYLRYPLAYRRIALSSFLSYAFGHTIGLSILGGGVVRYRLLSAWGLSTLDITRVTLFCSATYWTGFLALGGLALWIDPAPLPIPVALSLGGLRGLGVGFLLLLTLYLVWCGSERGLVLRGVRIDPPALPLALRQVLTATADWTFAAGALYMLLPATPTLSFPRFLGLFVFAAAAALASHVPGGLGVFETICVVMLRPYLPADRVLGAVFAFRIIYYLLPLALGVALLAVVAVHGTTRRGADPSRARRFLLGWLPQAAPRILAVATFACGAVLLLSAATPGLPRRMGLLHTLVPLPVVEISHFLSSAIGTALLLLARGIQRRLHGAWWLACVLLGAGIVTSVLKGLDREEALLLALVLATLLPLRRAFYRRGAWLGRPLTAGWLAAIVLVIQGVVLLGFWSQSHVAYSTALWWQFAFPGDLARTLRAGVGVAAVLGIYGAARLLRPSAPPSRWPGAHALGRARAVVARCPESAAHLALLGDKSLLFGDRGDAFLMYAVAGRSWVALGDPCGAPAERRELAWRFRELVDRYGGWTVFYGARPEHLPLYLELGLSLLKLGDEARVALASFSLDGEGRKELRGTLERLERERCEFAVLGPAERPDLLGALRRISDDWLAHRHPGEKRFALGFFDERYLSQTPLALVRRDGDILAFANLWPGAEREELSVDLLRHASHAPAGVRDYLLTRILLWGQEQGYRSFPLGMAPFSGFERRPRVAPGTRAGALLLRHAEMFYPLEGLRPYRDKLDPQWSPRYLASPGGVSLPRILTDVASLIGGGPAGNVAR